eukprot:Rhum_TRINITY_DN14822_c4_g1::Rhum_TRINITY_DN14822_c4_g1_i1::g.121771::m.121771
MKDARRRLEERNRVFACNYDGTSRVRTRASKQLVDVSSSQAEALRRRQAQAGLSANTGNPWSASRPINRSQNTDTPRKRLSAVSLLQLLQKKGETHNKGAGNQSRQCRLAARTLRQLRTLRLRRLQGFGTLDLFPLCGNLHLLLLRQVRLVLDHPRPAAKHLLVVLVDGVLEVVADGVEGLLRLLEVVHRLRLLLLQQPQLLLHRVPQHVQLLLLVAVLLRVRVERLDAELQLDVRAADGAVDLLQPLLLLVDQRPQRQVQHPEVLQVLLVHPDPQLRQLLVRLVEPRLHRAAPLRHQLLDQPRAPDRQVAVVHRQLQQLLVLRRNLQELRVLHPPLLLPVVLLDPPLHLLEPLRPQLLQLPLQVLDLPPALLLLLQVLLHEPLALVLHRREPLHRLRVLEVRLLDRVVDVLQVRLAPLLQPPLRVLHLRRLLVRLLLNLVDLLERRVLILRLLDQTELVLDQLDQTLLQLDLRPELLLRNLHLAVAHRHVLDLVHAVELCHLRRNLLVRRRQRSLDLRHVHDVLHLLQRRGGHLRKLRRVQLRPPQLLLHLLHLRDRVVDHARERHDPRLVPVVLQLRQLLPQPDHVHELRLVLRLVQLPLRHLQPAHPHQLRQVVRLRQVPLRPHLHRRQQLVRLLVRPAQLLPLVLAPVRHVQLLDELLVLQARRLQLQVVDLLLPRRLEGHLALRIGHCSSDVGVYLCVELTS